MPSYKLVYFNGKGRAEVTRYLFALGKVDYEDKRVAFGTEWEALKPQTPFGSMPVLEVDGVPLCQSNAIARYVAKITGLAGTTDLEQAKADMIVDCMEEIVQSVIAIAFGDDAKKAATKAKFEGGQKDTSLGNLEKFLAENKTGYFVGDSLTWADVSIVLGLEWALDVTAIDFSKYPRLKKLQETVNSRPEIVAWLQKRPQKQDF